MGSQFSAPVKIRSERSRRGLIALLLVLAVLAAITVTGTGIANATNLSGGFAPKVYNGLIDINGDGQGGSGDNADELFPGTKVIAGKVACDGWTNSAPLVEGDANTFDDDSDTDLSDGADNCLLRANNGSSGHYYIWIESGVLTKYTTGSFASGIQYEIPWGWQLPFLYKTALTMNYNTLSSGVEAAFYASSGVIVGIATPFTTLTEDDCSGTRNYVTNGRFGDGSTDDLKILGHGCDVLVDASDNGMVDLNGDKASDADDSCYNGCFWGYNVANGLLQTERPGDGTMGLTGLQGVAGTNGVSGRVSISASTSTNSMNKSKSAMCSGTTKVLGGGYTITAAASTLAHLTVVANGQISGGWKVRVLEATPTAGTWAVTVNVICATA